LKLFNFVLVVRFLFLLCYGQVLRKVMLNEVSTLFFTSPKSSRMLKIHDNTCRHLLNPALYDGEEAWFQSGGFA
jgi:hypothetical protein